MTDSTNDELRSLANKNIKLFTLMNQWTRLLQDKKTVAEYFDNRNYKRIAVYGFGIVGETLERELRNTDIRIIYFVDRNADYLYAPAKVISPDDEFDEVDVLVVTAIDNPEELVGKLRQRCPFDVVSIDELIKGV